MEMVHLFLLVSLIMAIVSGLFSLQVNMSGKDQFLFVFSAFVSIVALAAYLLDIISLWRRERRHKKRFGAESG